MRGHLFKSVFNTFLIVSGEMRRIVKLLQSSTNNYSIVVAFLRNLKNISHFFFGEMRRLYLRRISPELFLIFFPFSGEMRRLDKLLKTGKYNYSIFDAFLRNFLHFSQRALKI